MIKKVVKLIMVIIILISFIISFTANKSYGICNTAQFSKEVSAIQLTLSDGKILYDMRIEKKVQDQANLLPDSYKKLKLIFVVETQNYVEENKKAINSFIDKVYKFYEGNEEKVEIGIIPFKDLTKEQLNSRQEKINTKQEVLTTSKEDIERDVKKLKTNEKRTLQEALLTVQNAFSETYDNDKLLQYMVFITDGIENANFDITLDGKEQNMLDASHGILKDISDNMVGMYGILIGTSKSKDANLKKIFDKEIREMTTADNMAISNVLTQLEESVYKYIEEFAIRESTLMPAGGVKGALLTPDAIVLTADEELIHGATLKIEYTISLSRYAAYGDGTIYMSKFIDEKDDKLTFSENTRLLTEPDKTNKDYGWHMTNEGIVTEEDQTEAKIILSALLTPQQYNNSRFSNTARCMTAFDVGDGSAASYDLVDKAIDVVILPPFGKEEQFSIWQIATITFAIAIMIFGFCLMLRASRKNNKQ